MFCTVARGENIRTAAAVTLSVCSGHRQPIAFFSANYTAWPLSKHGLFQIVYSPLSNVEVGRRRQQAFFACESFGTLRRFAVMPED